MVGFCLSNKFFLARVLYMEMQIYSIYIFSDKNTKKTRKSEIWELSEKQNEYFNSNKQSVFPYENICLFIWIKDDNSVYRKIYYGTFSCLVLSIVKTRLIGHKVKTSQTYSPNLHGYGVPTLSCHTVCPRIPVHFYLVVPVKKTDMTSWT